VLPSLAVAEALGTRGAAVTFAGSPSGIEARLVRSAGFELDTYEVKGFPRCVGVPLLRAVGLAAMAPVECVRILRRRQPDVVLGGGGYVAGPMVAGAALLRVPAALMEADAHLGLANRITAPFAKKVFLAFPIDGLEPPKYEVVGRPIPARARAEDAVEARRRFGLPTNGRVVLVFGGSQGARALNEAAVAAFAADGPAVLHLSGERDYAALADRVRRPDYKLVAFTDDFGAALAASDLVVARAGGSVWEVAAAGKPALLVPYPFATAGHQAKNAGYFERGGGAISVREDELDVRARVEELLADPGRLDAMGAAMKSLARPDAAERVAQGLIALASA
jgi:UDP-N-acetylglucosamine--N-acetylmuramyl-(pentapeptide) pyrophosphoryl-undecaprenol N-acetylglucosamine transferase